MTISQDPCPDLVYVSAPSYLSLKSGSKHPCSRSGALHRAPNIKPASGLPPVHPPLHDNQYLLVRGEILFLLFVSQPLPGWRDWAVMLIFPLD